MFRTPRAISTTAGTMNRAASPETPGELMLVRGPAVALDPPLCGQSADRRLLRACGVGRGVIVGGRSRG